MWGMALGLYLTIAWGADGEDDTYFLVRADTPADAAQMADERITMMPSPYADPRCNEVIALGTDGFEGGGPKVLVGPLSAGGIGVAAGYRTWTRDTGEDWREMEEENCP